MNCQPFGHVVCDSRVERACPYFHRQSLWEMDTYGNGWSHHAAPQTRIRRACEEDDARYMEAVRR